MHRRTLLPLVSGSVGMVLAHGAAYLLAPAGAPGFGRGHAAHGYWHHAPEFGAIAAGLAVLLAASSGLAPNRTGRAGLYDSLFRTVAWQLSLFTLLEVGERVGAGEPIGALLQTPVFWLGLALQFVTATVVLLLLAGVERVIAAAVGSRRRFSRRTSVVADRPVCRWVRSALTVGRPPGRAPPSLTA